MGNLINKINEYKTCQPKKVLVLGLDGVGKTSLLYSAISRGAEIETTIPTMGNNIA